MALAAKHTSKLASLTAPVVSDVEEELLWGDIEQSVDYPECTNVCGTCGLNGCNENVCGACNGTLECCGLQIGNQECFGECCNRYLLAIALNVFWTN